MSIVKDVFGSSEEKESTSKKTLDPPSAEEQKLLDQQLELATQQLTALRELGDFTSARFEEFLPVLSSQVNKFSNQQDSVASKNFDFASTSAGAQNQLLQGELRAIAQGTGATPEQTALISAAADSAIEAGLSDIRAFRDDSLEQIGSELAPGRGLRTDDTPVLDVAGRVARDSTRQAEKLITNVRGQQAQAQLEYPLQAAQVQSGRVQAQQGITQSTAQFAEQLRQQAFNNRLNLTALTGSQGLNLAAATAPNPGTLTGLQQLRSDTGTVTGSQSVSSFDPIALIGAAGGAASGAGALGFSDRRLKTEIEPVGDVDGQILYRFRYKGDPKNRLGFMADEVPVEYTVEHPSGYKMIDYAALLPSAAA
tara:strand:- start:12547 stop:13647 length:1101 start_codon:yes stop_codon:yes gene_type:complete